LLLKKGFIVKYNLPRNIKEFINTNNKTIMTKLNPFNFIKEIIKSI
jgi:hypothetical protein